MYLAKDFVETREGLVFAVVENGMEQGKVLCFLRYIQVDGQWKKVSTEAANQFLLKTYAHYLYFSSSKQAALHAVTTLQIIKHYQPRLKLNELLNQQSTDAVENDVLELCHLFEKQGLELNDVGITGSVLIAAQKNSSDIDLVIYNRELFHRARGLIAQMVEQNICSTLSEDEWRKSYDRRDCDLGFSDYLWHEKRKFNKLLINQRKVDLSFVCDIPQNDSPIHYKKLESITIKAQVTDDSFTFDYPSMYSIEHPQINTIICYTATYTGQAISGEWVEVSGMLEEDDNGNKRIIVGSSREARGQYIKVIQSA